MNIKQIFIILFLTITSIQADYSAKIPLEINNGGHLPNNSIIIKNNGGDQTIICDYNYNNTTYIRTFDNFGETIYLAYFNGNLLDEDLNITRGDFIENNKGELFFELCMPFGYMD